jgi:hypothetical protein
MIATISPGDLFEYILAVIFGIGITMLAVLFVASLRSLCQSFHWNEKNKNESRT